MGLSGSKWLQKVWNGLKLLKKGLKRLKTAYQRFLHHRLNLKPSLTIWVTVVYGLSECEEISPK